MQITRYPEPGQWASLLQRPSADAAALEKSVKKVLQQVRRRGDAAVRKYTRQFDGVSIRHAEVKPKDIRQAKRSIDPGLAKAIQAAAENIRAFHALQLNAGEETDTMRGVHCYRRSVAIEKVGLYIPGGTAPLFSTVLMLGIPAALAGCREIVLCTPPAKDGSLHPAILYAADLVGITRIFRVGGVQAIAAMAYGTESIPAVYKIFGPGNAYVTLAKQLVQQDGVSIDMPAGPSEVCVLADDSAMPAFVAADLLSQAEHGIDSQVMLVTTSSVLVEKVLQEIQRQIVTLPRISIAQKALENSRAIVMKNMEEAMQLVNAYAPEHLIIACDDHDKLSARVVNAGSVFLGHFTPESAGDYASGTNHTLPTNGYARAYSGVSVDSFVKKITFQQISDLGLEKLGPVVMTMAEHEGLHAHARAVRIRMEKISAT